MTAAVNGRTMSVSEWRPYVKNTLQGFFTLTLPSGLVIHGCTFHTKGDSRWVGLPAQKIVKEDATSSYTPIIEFTTREAKDRFQAAALAAVDEVQR
jgi:hypothetical protein